MPKFGKLRVKNYVTFKKASLDLDQVGITHIQALNKDASSAETTNGRSTNAAGKSVFFGAISELHWGASPTGKDTVKSQQPSVIALEYKDVGGKGDVYDIQRKFGKKKGFRILRNGEDTNIRTIDLASKRAEAVLGMSEQDFFTRVYIDSLNPHPLIVGSAAQRQDFFVEMFGLHSADSIRKMLLSQYREAQQHRSAYLEVRSMFEEMRDKAISTEDYEAKKAELKELTEKQASLLKKFRKTQSLRDLLMFEEDNAKLIKRVRKIVDGGGFDYVLETLQKEHKRLKRDLEAAQAWIIYDKETARAEEKAKPIYAQLRELIGDNWMFKGEVVDTKARKARKAADEERELRAELKGLKVGDKPAKVAEPKHSYEECVAKISKLQEELEHATKFHKGKCPTCGSEVEARPADTVREEVAKWKARRADAKAYIEYDKARADWKESRSKASEIEERLADAAGRAKKLAKWLEVEQLHKRLPDTVHPPEGKRVDGAGLQEKIDDVYSRLQVLKNAQPVIDKIAECEALTDEQREQAKSFDRLGDKLTDINNRVATLSAELNSAKQARDQIELLAQRGKTLKRKAADEPILKALIEAHSNKGLKKLMIERYAKLLQDQINKFRKLFFVEDYEFEFSYDKKLQVLVHRKYGKFTKVSDVRKLSGAEKRMFTILLVVATITLLPASKRSNVLILDEPEANLGPAQQNLFVRALPVLQKIVPHIVVISPRADLEIPGAKVYTVVKHKGVSTIVKGAVA